MDVIALNKNAWNQVGNRLVSPNRAHAKFAEVFGLFCESLPAGAAVLDFGCGTGVPYTSELAGCGFLVTGIDLSDAMVAAARARVPNAQFVCASMTEVEYRDQFDAVFAGYSMICLTPEDFAVAAFNAVRALKAGGLLLLALNEPADHHPVRDADCVERLYDVEMYVRPYTEREIRDVFEPLGMTVTLVERERVFSETYGSEHTMLCLMKKDR